MLKRRFLKTVIAFLCIVTILMPYTTNVFGAMTQEQTKAKLTVLMVREGGDESSGTLPNAYVEHYDETPYKYTIADTTVFKIVEEGDSAYSDALYCLDGERSFPGILNNEQVAIEYRNVADLTNDMNEIVASLDVSEKEYNALIWLVNNMFLRKQAPEQKDEYLTKAFKGLIADGTSLDEIKATLTDDDIEVIQQWAIWNFTNSETEKYTKFSGVSLLDPLSGKSGTYASLVGDATRQVYANDLYNYLVAAALAGKTEKLSYPKISNNILTSVVDGEYYKVGPFKVSKGEVPEEQYKLRLLDKDGNEIDRSKYEILIEGQNAFSKQNVENIFDTNYYIYLPIENNNITTLTLKLEYSEYKTEASLWTANKEVYQPVTLITRDSKPVEEKVTVNIEEKAYDLALRKYILKVDGKEVNRAPVVDTSNLKNNIDTTAVYKHSKNMIEVKPGQSVVYEIRVYNEGEIDGNVLKIVDYLPAGLKLKENSTINDTYGWNTEVVNGYTVATTEALKNNVIKAYNKDLDILESKYVQIECVVEDSADSGKILTNVAEIITDNVIDRDSNEGSINYSEINETYSGNANNKADLSDSNYYYAGLEDDDDFEKLIVEGGTFDLSLQKFITKVNKVAPEISREPKVDVTSLKNGLSKDAKYTTIKTPLVVEQGDVITYKIRVYNEGEISGYAEEVADYIPAGLGFLVNHTTNVDNYWKVTSVKSVKLESIPNAMDNLSLEDFTGVSDLKSVDVVYDSKIISTKLKSSDLDTKNLIDGFDPNVDTTLDYKDIEIACVVVDATAVNNNFKNIAEIVKHSDEDRDTTIVDRDSTPDTVDPQNYPGNDGNQDDNDYELVTPAEPKDFDLSLQKVITHLNGAQVERSLKVSKNSNGKLEFTHPTTPLAVANGDLVTYRILVFNEGEVAGYAKEIKDNLPEGLTFVKDNETNIKYEWKLLDKNGKETSDLAQAVSVKTNYLSKEKSADNILKAFGDESVAEVKDVGRLDYKFVEIVFKVDAKSSNNEIINIAEISDDSDEDGNPVDDIDSTPNNNKDGEDDLDKEKVKLQEFDLSLKKFISAVNNASITDREPKVSKGTDGKLVYSTKKDAVKVINNDLVTYTIRVYNEGDMAGYAKEISDNIPIGLEFVQDNAINKKFGWKLYDESGNETTDLSKAKTVKTNYLSRDVSTSNILNAYNPDADITNSNPSYKDVQIVFKVVEANVKVASRELINIAEITEDTDSNGNAVTDIDSTPNNNKDGEDDLDKEKVYVQYFDLSLQKDLTKVIVIEDGVTREVASKNELMKVEINRRKIDSTTVKFVYNIIVKNEGEIEGYATELKDYIPEGLEFIAEDNPSWKKAGDNAITTRELENKLLKPGETASVQVILKWKNAEDNMGQKVNVAEISEDKNNSATKDVDSTPNNKVMTEDDIDDAPVILSVSTGKEPTMYTALALIVLVILATGISLIKKYVLL